MKVLLFILFSGLTFCMSAQKLTVGPVLKIGASWFSDQSYSGDIDVFKNKPLMSYALGVNLNFKPFKRSGVILQIECVKKGASETEYFFDSDFFSYDKVKLYYVNIPLKFYREFYEKFSVEIGAEFGRLIDKNISERKTYNYDAGLTGGFSFTIKKLHVGMEYYFGMLPLFNVIQIDLSDTGYLAKKYELYNQNLVVTVSYDLFSTKRGDH